jgi:hypothetical protein
LQVTHRRRVFLSTFDPRMAGRNVRFISSAQKAPIIN